MNKNFNEMEKRWNKEYYVDILYVMVEELEIIKSNLNYEQLPIINDE